MKKDGNKNNLKPKKKESNLLKKIVVILLLIGLIGMYVVLPIISMGS